MSFWEQTFSADVFWSALAAIATFSAVVAAFLVPYLQGRHRMLRACKHIVFELQRNRDALDHLQLEVPEKTFKIRGKTMFYTPLKYSHHRFSISETYWNALRFEIPSERAACYAKAYLIFRQFLSEDGTPNFAAIEEDEIVLKTHAESLRSAREKYDTLANDCRYFKV